MLDHSDLHWHDLELLADVLTNAVFYGNRRRSLLVLGQFVDDFDAQKIGGQRLALTALFGWRYDLFFHRFVDRLDHGFSFVEQGHLRGRGIDCLL